jgi:hypothetical protein
MSPLSAAGRRLMSISGWCLVAGWMGALGCIFGSLYVGKHAMPSLEQWLEVGGGISVFLFFAAFCLRAMTMLWLARRHFSRKERNE